MKAQTFFTAKPIKDFNDKVLPLSAPAPAPLAAKPSNVNYFTGPQLRTAYSYQSVTNNNGIRKVKIAIIIAYTYKNLLTDLKIPNSVIEYIDANEQNLSMIAMKPEDLANNKNNDKQYM
jgi:hypothetical protein